MELTTKDLWDVLRLIKTGDLTSEDLVMQCLEKARYTAHLNAFTYVNKDRAIASAKKVDAKIKLNKHTGILAGIPVAIKDNFSTVGMPTSCASNMLKGHVYDLDATAVTKLKEQDAVIMGKANMDEFAMGNANVTSAFGRVKHPINNELVPGGSSGGSAVSVAVGSSFAALGTDTGGSVRQPASYCGITGLKPTFGRISRHGVFPLAPSLDHVGICTKTVKDNLLVFETVYGPDKFDRSTQRDENLNFDTHCLEYTNKRLKIGVMKQSFKSIVHPEIRENFDSVVSFFTNEGYVVEEIDFKLSTYVSMIYSILCCGGVVKNLSKMDGVNVGNIIDHAIAFEDAVMASRGEFFGLEAKRRLIYGQYVTKPENYAAYYDKARRIRTLIIEYFKGIFQKYDIVICPTTTCPAHKHDKDMYVEQIEYNDVFVATANLTGRPALTVPCGKSKDGLPFGVQFMGKTFNENDLFNIAYFFEQNVGKDFITRI